MIWGLHYANIRIPINQSGFNGKFDFFSWLTCLLSPVRGWNVFFHPEKGAKLRKIRRIAPPPVLVICNGTSGSKVWQYVFLHISGQIIATSYAPLTPKGSFLEGKFHLFEGNPGWWKIFYLDRYMYTISWTHLTCFLGGWASRLWVKSSKIWDPKLGSRCNPRSLT